MTTTASIPTTEAEWKALTRVLPGYDPWNGIDGLGLRFDGGEAARAIGFFHECLTHVEGLLAGTPFYLEPWQQAFIGNLFGWIRPDGTRRYREAFLFVPRKNGKSVIVAGVVVFILACDGEHGAQLYSAAADKDQAALVFRQAAGMVRNHPGLSSIISVYGGMSRRSLVYEDHQSVYRALSSDAKTKHGLTPSVVVIDEEHALPDRELVDTLATGMASKNRKNPLLLHVTTSDYDRPSVCNEKQDYAEKVRDGTIIDPYFLPAIYMADRTDDWTDEAVWAKANPNLGISVSVEYLRAECEKAKHNPALENTFRRLHLNQKTTTDVAWMPPDIWDGTSGLAEGETPEAWRARMLEECKGRQCIIGVDLSQKIDITAVVLIFPPIDGDDWTILPYFWVPGENAREKEKRDHAPYSEWARRGFLKFTEGNWIEFEEIKEFVVSLVDDYEIVEFAYDPAYAAWLANEMEKHGITICAVRQGAISLSEPMKTVFGLASDGVFHHGGNPVLRWMMLHTAVKTDENGNIRPNKAKSTQRIDGVTATITGMARALVLDLQPGWDYSNGLPGV